MTEEAGELMSAMPFVIRLMELHHIHLKGAQGIRGTADLKELQHKKEDAVGDILIYMLSYCNRNGIVMAEALANAWDEVKQRDWVEYPENGVDK